MEEFSLHREAKEQYQMLVPEKHEGLILLRLYERFGDEEFSEAQINDTIAKVYKDLGRSFQRTEHERNNSIISRFQEYFLWRDEIRKTYRFKSYGTEFCKRIQNRLLERYNPAAIKRFFDALLAELHRYMSTDDLTIDLWIADHFEARKDDIAREIETLDQQVSETVKVFRHKIKSENPELLKLLDDVENGLNQIKNQAEQLKSAFKATYDIDDVLEPLLFDPTYNLLVPKINQVLTFNADIRSRLEHVSKRIDKIKPRIREFIYDFNQRDFDRKTGIFLNYLLSNSKLSLSANGRTELQLPEEIPPYCTYDKSELPQFISIPDRNLARKQPTSPVKLAVNEERKERMLAEAKLKLLERQRVQYWIDRIHAALKESNAFDYSKYLFSILEKDGNDLSLVVKISAKVIRDFTKRKKYVIDITPDLVKSPMFPELQINQLWIRKI